MTSIIRDPGLTLVIAALTAGLWTLRLWWREFRFHRKEDAERRRLEAAAAREAAQTKRQLELIFKHGESASSLNGWTPTPRYIKDAPSPEAQIAWNSPTLP